MLEAVEGARESVRVLSYVYWTGDIGGPLRRRPERRRGARRRGCGWCSTPGGGRKIDPALTARMSEAGVRIAWFHPLEWSGLRSLNQRTHRKIMIVDHEVAFAGGVGIAEEWQGDAAGEDEWRDDHFRITGPAVRYLDGSFAENWLNASGELLLAGAGDDDAHDDVAGSGLGTDPGRGAVGLAARRRLADRADLLGRVRGVAEQRGHRHALLRAGPRTAARHRAHRPAGRARAAAAAGRAQRQLHGAPRRARPATPSCWTPASSCTSSTPPCCTSSRS